MVVTRQQELSDGDNTEVALFEQASHAGRLGSGPVSRSLSAGTRKLQHVYMRHGGDFGFSENWNASNGERFQSILQSFVNRQDIQVISGTYRNTQPVIHYFDPASGRNVMVDLEGNLVSAWKLSIEQISHLFSSGNLQYGRK